MRSSPVLGLLSAVTDASQRNLEDVVQRSEREDTSGDSCGSKNESPWVAGTSKAASYGRRSREALFTKILHSRLGQWKRPC